MSIRDTFVRVNRHRANDSRTGRMSLATWAVLTQVWAIASDVGEQDGDDVVVDARALEAGEVVMELPRSATLEDVEKALAEIESSGCLMRTENVVRVRNLAKYNRDRFRKREERRAEKLAIQQRLGKSGQPAGGPRAAPGRQMPSADGGAGTTKSPGTTGGTLVLKGQVLSQTATQSSTTRDAEGVAEVPTTKPKKKRDPFRGFLDQTVEMAKASGHPAVVKPRMPSKDWNVLRAVWSTCGDTESLRLWKRWLALPRGVCWHRDQGHGFRHFSAAVRDGDAVLMGSDPVESLQASSPGRGRDSIPNATQEARQVAIASWAVLEPLARGGVQYSNSYDLGHPAANRAAEQLGGVGRVVSAMKTDARAAKFDWMAAIQSAIARNGHEVHA